jgi:hypothetical protein
MPGNDRSLEVEGLFPDWIELHNPTADAVDLDGWTVSDDEDEPEKHELDGGMVLEPGGFLLLYADALPYLGPQHLDFRLTGKGEVVALYAPDGRGSVVRYGEIADDLAAARASDCCEELDCWTFPFAGTPGETNEVVVPVTEEVFPEGRLWRFLDTGGGPPPGWRSPGFDDSGWDLGDAPLGYGDGHIVTEVDYGGDAGDKYVTTYFRYGFAVTDVDRVIGAAVRVLRDDGVVVYLNGTEVLRSNLPGGDLDSETMALDAASGAEETVFFRFDVDEALLVEGANVFAAEVHQATSGSSDLGFDLSFEVDRLP